MIERVLIIWKRCSWGRRMMLFIRIIWILLRGLGSRWVRLWIWLSLKSKTCPSLILIGIAMLSSLVNSKALTTTESSQRVRCTTSMSATSGSKPKSTSQAEKNSRWVNFWLSRSQSWKVYFKTKKQSICWLNPRNSSCIPHMTALYPSFGSSWMPRISTGTISLMQVTSK